MMLTTLLTVALAVLTTVSESVRLDATVSMTRRRTNAWGTVRNDRIGTADEQSSFSALLSSPPFQTMELIRKLRGGDESNDDEEEEEEEDDDQDEDEEEGDDEEDDEDEEEDEDEEDDENEEEEEDAEEEASTAATTEATDVSTTTSNQVNDDDETEYDEPLVKGAMTDMYIVFGGMMLSQRLNFDDPTLVRVLRYVIYSLSTV